MPSYNPKTAHPPSEEDQEIGKELNFDRYKSLVENHRTIIYFFFLAVLSYTIRLVPEETAIKEVSNKVEQVIADQVSAHKGPHAQEEYV